MLIVLGNSSLARYRRGGGHWSVRIQYLLGLRALGHQAVLLELLTSSGDAARDDALVRAFFERLEAYGLAGEAALLLLPRPEGAEGAVEGEQDLARARAFGRSLAQVKALIRGADLLLNDCCGVRQPLLGLFRHRVLVDLDPGHLQVSALTWEMGIHDHHAFLSVGGKMEDADCEVPRLGVRWRAFLPFVHLPLWEAAPDPGARRPFSSVTHWAWGELWWEGRVLGLGKRDGYLPFVELPRRTRRPFELAVRFNEADTSGDRESLLAHGWTVADPWAVAASPAGYRAYIAGSRAEISCVKPIFRELRTGWFSDRSACYLASGRPVLAQETGFSERLPVGEGLLAFRTLEEAAAGVEEIDRRYPEHMRAARRLAEEYLDARRCLPAMLEACG